MALVVEDGTGVVGANTLVSESEVTTFLQSRNKAAAWLAASAVEREAAILSANDYLEITWSHRLEGTRKHTLSFPRDELYSKETGDRIEGVPNEIKYALSEYANASLSSELLPTETAEVGIVRKKEVVGPIETEIEYTSSANAKTIRRFPLADGYVRRFCMFDSRPVIR